MAAPAIPAGAGHDFGRIAVEPPAPATRAPIRTWLPGVLETGVERLSAPRPAPPPSTAAPLQLAGGKGQKRKADSDDEDVGEETRDQPLASSPDGGPRAMEVEDPPPSLEPKLGVMGALQQGKVGTVHGKQYVGPQPMSGKRTEQVMRHYTNLALNQLTAEGSRRRRSSTPWSCR